MKSKFERYIHSLLFEQEAPKPPAPEEEGSGVEMPEQEEGGGLESEIMPEPEQTFPEEIELAKLAIRAIYFNPSSKDVHNLKLKSEGKVIPFEMISDYYERTKNMIPVLGFIEWAMDKYEGFSSKWTETPEVKGESIIQKLKHFNKTLPEEQKLDNGKRVYWVRIILNCLLHGNANFNINIGDVNEKTIKEVFRLLDQHFSGDTRGLFPNMGQIKGPSTI
jgi:hypothetical protein